MSAEPQTQPVIPYAASSLAAACAFRVRETDDGGVEFVFTPPALWRQLLGPASGLALLTPAVGLLTFMCLVLLLQAPAAGALLSVVAITTFGVWVLALVRLCRIGKYGGLAPVVRASASGLQVIVPTLGRESHRQFATAAMVDVWLEDRSAVHVVINVILIRVRYRGGMMSEVRIPWRGGEAIEPVERRVREALGLPASDRA